MDGVERVMGYLDSAGYVNYPEVKPIGSSDDMPYLIVRLIRENVPTNETLMPSGISVDDVQVDIYGSTIGELASTSKAVKGLLTSKGNVWFLTGFPLPEQDANGVILWRRVHEYRVRY